MAQGEMPRPLRGKVAVVTGSTGAGMGRSIALTLARAGASVVLNYGTGRRENANAAREVARVIEGYDSNALIVKADTRSAPQVKALVERTLKVFGRLDILVINAGGAWIEKDIADADPAQMREVLQAEIDGMLWMLKYALPVMRRQKYGRVITLAMDRAEHWTIPPYDAVAGKVARLFLTRAFAKHEAKRGITVNAIAPGYMEPFATLAEAVAHAEHQAAWRKRTRATPQDAADIALFLCSEEGRYINNSVIGIVSNPLEE